MDKLKQLQEEIDGLNIEFKGIEDDRLRIASDIDSIKYQLNVENVARAEGSLPRDAAWEESAKFALMQKQKSLRRLNFQRNDALKQISAKSKEMARIKHEKSCAERVQGAVDFNAAFVKLARKMLDKEAFQRIGVAASVMCGNE